MVLVPATMALLGNANWWLPTWLDRVLPHVASEGATNTEDEFDQPETDENSQQGQGRQELVGR
jgi:hypothetical protein